MNKAIIKISLIILCLAAFSSAQKGTVSGTVVDEHGAVIPGTRIEFISDKGRTFSSSTIADGEYRIELESGLYKVIASRAPFTDFIFANYWVPQSSLRLDIALRCIDCKTLDCPLADLPLVDAPSLIIAKDIQYRPLEKLPVASKPKAETKKTKKKINE